MQALDCRSAEKRNVQELSFFQYVQIKYAIFLLTCGMHKLYGALWRGPNTPYISIFYAKEAHIS